MEKPLAITESANSLDRALVTQSTSLKRRANIVYFCNWRSCSPHPCLRKAAQNGFVENKIQKHFSDMLTLRPLAPAHPLSPRVPLKPAGPLSP